MSALIEGDRVAYAAVFLKNTGQFTGPGPQRRGTFVKVWKSNPDFARVKWDDFEQIAAALAQHLGEDYVDDAREHGQLVNINNIAKVGSARFALTCAGA
ncbi:hypothetical protein QA639_21360 [Bradyrhizobium pachyrhizi]|uniref:hypothetical protein n=1 Tax=Bradyrhizobium pachyrhizi TaxID=280333 RepID=UPI0024B13145|nr:hypothetical protein [Bradyrhizobium pachyrhizi]WFU52259.1 hypothetical protein QA639_21360 [Bradyrhizobium pachyrhizi]